VVYHRLLGQDETVRGRVPGGDIHAEERNDRERLHHICHSCRDDGHDTLDLVVERGNRDFIGTRQRALIRKLVEFDLTDFATAFSAALF
jgi:hypothetical protein